MLKCDVQDIAFELFQNENREAGFAIHVVKDAKGMTFMPNKRLVIVLDLLSHHSVKLIIGKPKHSLHEGLEPRPLF